MGRQKLLETQYAQISFTKIIPVKCVYLWISIQVAHSLYIHSKDLVIRCFVCEMGKRLRGIPLLFADASEIVVVFAILPFDVRLNSAQGSFSECVRE